MQIKQNLTNQSSRRTDQSEDEDDLDKAIDDLER
jgi:hypothetical protein